MSNSNHAELHPKKTSSKIIELKEKMGRLNNKFQSIGYGLA